MVDPRATVVRAPHQGCWGRLLSLSPRLQLIQEGLDKKSRQLRSRHLVLAVEYRPLVPFFLNDIRFEATIHLSRDVGVDFGSANAAGRNGTS